MTKELKILYRLIIKYKWTINCTTQYKPTISRRAYRNLQYIVELKSQHELCSADVYLHKQSGLK